MVLLPGVVAWMQNDFELNLALESLDALRWRNDRRHSRRDGRNTLRRIANMGRSKAAGQQPRQRLKGHKPVASHGLSEARPTCQRRRSSSATSLSPAMD
jgi:hypothetical protein